MSLDLTAIKARREKQYNWTGSRSEMIADIDALLLEVERLREQNKQLGEALREYNDAELYYAHKDED